MEPQRGSISLALAYAATLCSAASALRRGAAALGSRAAALDRMAMTMALDGAVAPTFSVFRRLEIVNFNIFLCFWHIRFSVLAYLLLFVLYLWHRTTIYCSRLRHSLLGSGHPDGSICLSCALAFDWLTLRRAHFFCSSVRSLWLPITTLYANSSQRSTEQKRWMHFSFIEKDLRS